MKKTILLFALLFGSSAFVFSQVVDSIKVEQAGDFIKIGYKILNSTPDQIFRVRVLCSINGGLNTELRSVSGDVGDNIRGGREEYFAVWDVLKDVDELNSAEFIVRAELLAGSAVKPLRQSRRYFNVAAATQFPGAGIGIRTGYMGNAGISAQFMLGRTVFFPEFSGFETDFTARISVNFTKRLINSDASQLHMLVGPTVGEVRIVDTYQGSTNYPMHMSPGLELGLALCQKRTVLLLNAAKLFPDLTEEGEAITKHAYLGIGFGIRL